MPSAVQLVAIDSEGCVPGRTVRSPFIQEVCTATSELYRQHGFAPPWTGYLAFIVDQPVGTCAFKSPPQAGRVEIAYFTFPEFERRGIATEMARQLLEIAQTADVSVTVTAQTLPEESPSTKVLKKLRFVHSGIVHHPEDGDVWEWIHAPVSACESRTPRRPS